MGTSVKQFLLWIAFLLLPSSSWADSLSFIGSLDPNNANDVFLTGFFLSGSAIVNIQTWGYGGTADAAGGTNAAGMVILPGGFDPYISLFMGIGDEAIFLASNDDGSCPPGTLAPACQDSTLSIALPGGFYTLALTVFDNFSFAENFGSGTLGDGFIGLGNYFDVASGMVRTANYAVDITAPGISAVPEPGTLLLVSMPLVVAVLISRRRVQ